MMMAKRRKGLSDRHKKILEVLEDYQDNVGYPPSIREIGKAANISSTSVVNYYLNQLEEDGYIERDRKISRGVRLVKTVAGELKETAGSVASAIDEMFRIPVVGRIVASAPAPVPASDFDYYDAETGVDVARSLLPSKEKSEELYALEVDGDSMIDAMVNDGDIVIMKKASNATNGEMVSVWLTDKDETTLKYFYKENGRVRLQPANPTMDPIMIDDPSTLEIQGKVVMVIRQVEGAKAV
ncbi:MAG: repressor LexA [Chloroflexi bacterium]|nr:MAG: repressor LexA [Chloroflexota bacterium]MBL1196305.1 repressor LexA [Chloroflexota bacterium]NOH13600.1 repressor LexA [Chloroflexota bacterium]